MKKILFLSLIASSIFSCNSIKNHNASLTQLIPAEKLNADVDFAYKKIKKLHPKVNWYISEEKLNFKFDSLKNTISKPMTSFDFYKKLTPVVCEVRQGHMYVYPKVKKLTKTESAALTKKGVNPFAQFEFEIFDNKLYVVKNKSYNKSVSVGTEVVSINNKKTSELLNEYKNYFSSDGFNTTFFNKILVRSFPNYYTNQNGVKDSIQFDFKKNDSLKTVWIKRRIVDSVKIDKQTVKVKPTDAALKKIKAENLKKHIWGYDTEKKIFNRNLNFIEKDSSVAILKINSFTVGDYRKCYEEAFAKIKNTKSETLILDIRNNTGGRLSEIADLYGYLSDTSFVFMDKTEVTMKTSLLHADYFKGGGITSKLLKVVIAPIYYPFQFFRVKNIDGNYFYNSESSLQKIKDNAFKGKIYVLINGGCFSASSIISSNLKGSKRAIFVGEETGGTYNGTVAGQMPLIKIPNSKLNIKIALSACVPFYKTDVLGRGIFPDHEILPTLQDRINNVDPELNWVLNDLKKI